MLIDMTAHLWDQKWIPDRLKRDAAETASKRRFPPRDTAELYRKIAARAWDPSGATMVREMELLKIDAMNILPVDEAIMWDEEPEESIGEINRKSCLAMQKYPGKIYSFAGVDPRRAGAVKLFEKAVKEWGAKGLELYTTAGFYPTDRICYPFYEKARELNVPITFQTGQGHLRWLKYGDPIYLDDVAADFPELNLIMEHSGGNMYSGFVWTAIDVAANRPNVYCDLTEWQPYAVTDQPYFFRLLDIMRKRVGVHRILFGTHYPDARIKTYEPWADLWLRLVERAAEHGYDFSEEEAEMMRSGNAKRLLKIS